MFNFIFFNRKIRKAAEQAAEVEQPAEATTEQAAEVEQPAEAQA